MARGELSASQAQAMAPVIGVTGESVRMLVIGMPDDDTASRAADALNRTNRPWGHLVSVAEGPRVLSLVLDRPVETLERRIGTLFAERQWPDWRAGLSAIFRDVCALPAAFESAQAALQVAGPTSGIVLFDDLGPAAGFLKVVGRERAMEYVHRRDRPDRGLRREALDGARREPRELPEIPRSLRQAAADLNVHANTLQLRLARIAQLTGIDLHDPEQLGLIAVALAWRRLA